MYPTDKNHSFTKEHLILTVRSQYVCTANVTQETVSHLQ